MSRPPARSRSSACTDPGRARSRRGIGLAGAALSALLVIGVPDQARAAGQPAPAASPPPAASPSPPASPPPEALPPPSPVVSALAFARARAGVVPGGTASVPVSGVTGRLDVRVSNASVDARYDAAAGVVVLAGRAPGNAVVTVSDASGASASLSVLVAPAAGVVPLEATVELAGVVSPAFAGARVEAAIRRAAQLQPGASLSVAGVTVANPLQPGAELEALASVHVAGGGTFVDVDGTTSVHLRVDALDRMIPGLLFYSDDPEKIPGDDPGVLYRGRVEAGAPVRLFAYHVAEAADTNLSIALRPTAGDARVQILGYAAGPTDAYGYAGHVATLQYLLERSSQESAIVTASAAAPFISPLGYKALAAGELVTAIFDLRVLAGRPVDVEVIATDGDADPAEFLGAAPVAGDGHRRSGIYSLASVPPLALAFAAGGPEPAPFMVGDAGLPNLVPGGRRLGGDYGVLRDVALQLSNPTSSPQSIYLYEMPVAGSVTTTLWFDGDPQPTQVGCVRETANRYLVKEFDLAPGESRAVAGSYMTDGASSYPLALGLTSVAPSPPPDPAGPGGCNSRD